MGVDLRVCGNHSVAFSGKEITNKQDVLNRLNSLRFEDSKVLLEMCKYWNSPSEYDNEERIKRKKEWLERDLQIRSWRMSYEEDDYYPHTNEYEFVGPYGLEIQITKYYIFISPWISRYHRWYWTENMENIKWRDTWRYIIYQIIHILGGESALYFPDNMSDLSCFLPTEYYMPEFNQLVQIIFEKYTPCFTSFSEAAKRYMENTLDNDPFVVDKFEDIETIVKYE